MKKVGFILMLGLLLVVLGTNGNTAFAVDSVSGSKKMGKGTASYTNVITYSDSRCGKYGRAHYRGNSTIALDHIFVDWSAGGKTGSSKRYSTTVNDTKSNNRIPIVSSYGKFSFKSGSEIWGPNSYAFNCSQANSSNINGDNDLAVKEDNVGKLQQIYDEIKTNDNFKTSDSSDETIKEIIKMELSDSSVDLTVYQDEKGKMIGLDDFIVTSVKAENSVEPIADDVTFSNPNADNTTIIEVEIPKPVYKGEEKLKITGYVVLINLDGPRLESGISVAPY